jgi:hypothetical protein
VSTLWQYGWCLLIEGSITLLQAVEDGGGMWNLGILGGIIKPWCDAQRRVEGVLGVLLNCIFGGFCQCMIMTMMRMLARSKMTGV